MIAMQEKVYVNLKEFADELAADRLGVSYHQVYHWVRRGWVPSKQTVRKGPNGYERTLYSVHRSDVDRVKELLRQGLPIG